MRSKKFLSGIFLLSWFAIFVITGSLEQESRSVCGDIYEYYEENNSISKLASFIKKHMLEIESGGVFFDDGSYCRFNGGLLSIIVFTILWIRS